MKPNLEPSLREQDSGNYCLTLKVAIYGKGRGRVKFCVILRRPDDSVHLEMRQALISFPPNEKNCTLSTLPIPL
jgi:hypothetical protein